jgi:7-keto-8-aminopelargonate synthetase-like enzyme
MKKKKSNLSYFVTESLENINSYCSIPNDFDLYNKGGIDERPSVNFVLNDYLALRRDYRINQTAIKSINTDSNNVLMYQKTGEYLSWIFNIPVLLFPNSAFIHMKVMPVIINPDDAILYDRYIHSNMRIGVNLCRKESKYAETIQHNDIQVLEESLNKLKTNHKRIWYLADSIYPTLGDIFPISEIQRLLKTYEQFYVYIDDSKGMSWTGENGGGLIYNHFHNHPRVIITTSLSKGFGAEGGVLVCSNEKIKNQLSRYCKVYVPNFLAKPAILKAIIESAKVHLSDDIYIRQSELQKKIELLHTTSSELGLPLISPPQIPQSFFIVGMPDVSQEICFHLMKRGYYLNVANYPMVPFKSSGIMANITLHQTANNIRDMLNIFKDEYYKTLKRRNFTPQDILCYYETNAPLA